MLSMPTAGPHQHGPLYTHECPPVVKHVTYPQPGLHFRGMGRFNSGRRSRSRSLGRYSPGRYSPGRYSPNTRGGSPGRGSPGYSSGGSRSRSRSFSRGRSGSPLPSPRRRRSPNANGPPARYRHMHACGFVCYVLRPNVFRASQCDSVSWTPVSNSIALQCLPAVSLIAFSALTVFRISTAHRCL